jgi:hypothetical protein
MVTSPKYLRWFLEQRPHFLGVALYWTYSHSKAESIEVEGRGSMSTDICSNFWMEKNSRWGKRTQRVFVRVDVFFLFIATTVVIIQRTLLFTISKSKIPMVF